MPKVATNKQKSKEIALKSAATRKKNERIKQYTKVFESLPPERQKVLYKIIEYCASMEVHLDELEQRIKEEGFVERYNNGGGQVGTKESTASKCYATLMKLYNANLRVLISAMPQAQAIEQDDGFDDFLTRK